MIKKLAIFVFLFGVFSFSYAKNPPLRVAVAEFMPPFSMEAGNKQLFGFDVEMMQYICKELKRECRFSKMAFRKLIPALANNQADVAIGTIAITPKRAKIVNFSNPYFPSHAYFLASTRYSNKESNLKSLEKTLIGAQTNTIFEAALEKMNIKNATIKLYQFQDEMIEALSINEIDVALLDESTSKYWAVNSSGILKLIGQPIPYGNGLGIAINPKDPSLVPMINKALKKFLNSADYKKNYTIYIN